MSQKIPENSTKKIQKKKVTGKPKVPVSAVPSKNLKIIAGFIIAVTAYILYSNTLDHGFVLDDNSAIENNWLTKQGTEAIPTLFKTSYRYGFWKGADELYRPLPLSVFAILWDLFPDNPKPFHLLNVLCYSLTGFVLFMTLLKMLSQHSIMIPFVSSLIFIAHPVHTEVVANIKSFDEILSFLLILFSLLALFKYLESAKTIWIAVTAFLYFIAFLSKESAVSMLIIYPLIIYFFSKATFTKNLLITGTLAISAIGYFLMRNAALGDIVSTKKFAFIDNILTSAPDMVTRWSTAILLLGKYLLLLIFPHPLSSDYTYPQIVLNGWDNPFAWLSLLVHAGLLIYAIKHFKSKQLISFGILFYMVGMLLYSNLFLLIGSPFADRFLYVPSLGFSLIVAILILRIYKAGEIKPLLVSQFAAFFVKNKIVTGVLLLIMIPFSIKTIARNLDWKSNFQLYEADTRNSPRSARIHYFYANEIRKEKAMKATDPEQKSKYLDMSIREYNKAIELYPDYADAYGQLGVSYYRKGDRQKAFELYSRSIELKSTLAMTYNNMGVLYSEQNRHSEALEYYKKSVFFDPYYFDGWKNLGNTYAVLGDHNNSVDAFYNAVKFKKEDAEANYFLAVGLQQQGKEMEARKYFENAYRINPTLKR